MANGLCCACEEPLTKENCSLSVLKRNLGLCRACTKKRNADYYCVHREKCLSVAAARHRSLKGKWSHLKVRLACEKLSASDILWRFNFYAALVADNVCSYCLGPLNPAGNSLDRKDNKFGHTCFNVVPCCWQCNAVKGSRFTYEQMMLLAPALRKIKQESVTPRIEA